MQTNNQLREALKLASYFLHQHHMGAVYAPDGETAISCWDVAKVVDSALAAPPRNCDRFETADEAIAAYLAITHRRIVVAVFLDWLFAPAEGNEESNGSK